MINLLPPEQKKELLEEEKLRLVLILGVVLLSILISQTLLLFGVKSYILADLEIGKIYFQQKVEELKIPRIKGLEERVENVNLSFSGLYSFYQKQIDSVVILEKISKTLPKGTFLTTLNFNPSLLQGSLSGVSPTRESLLEFRDNLESEGSFSNVYFPPESWISPTDVNFNVNFKIK